MYCKYQGCTWQSIAPSEEVARRQYAEHVVRQHAKSVDADIPDGMVQIKLRDGGEWITMTRDEAHELHEPDHSD